MSLVRCGASQSYGKDEDFLQYIVNVHNIFQDNISVKLILSY